MLDSNIQKRIVADQIFFNAASKQRNAIAVEMNNTGEYDRENGFFVGEALGGRGYLSYEGIPKTAQTQPFVIATLGVSFGNWG
ncbi:MAG: hypothetical protein ACRC78_02655 [Planktothrix sp.]